jgi:dTDP-4-amino-4,6-dideoxygalactose transaminase
VGGRADATTFSLYATKNMAAGEGGLLTTDIGDVADAVRRLRNHGGVEQYRHEIVGLNSRLPEMAGALARRQLSRLEAANGRRRANARRLAEWCDDAWGETVKVPTEAATGASSHVFHQFTVRFDEEERRDDVAAHLRRHGVDVRQFYPYTVAELPGVERRLTSASSRLRDTVLSLPVHPALTEGNQAVLRDAIAASATIPAGR